MAGKQAAAKGDFKKAESFWRVALQGIDSQAQEKVAETLRSGPDGIKNLKPGDPTDDLGTVLLSRAQSSSATDASATRIEYRLPGRPKSHPGCNLSRLQMQTFPSLKRKSRSQRATPKPLWRNCWRANRKRVDLDLHREIRSSRFLLPHWPRWLPRRLSPLRPPPKNR